MTPRRKEGAAPYGATGARTRAPGGGLLSPLGSAALATLVWAGVIVSEVPRAFGNSGAGGLIWAAVVGAILGMTPVRRLLWPLAGLVMTLLLVIGFTPLIVGPVRRWPRRDLIAPPPPDAIVVMSGRVSVDGHLNPPAADRLLSGLVLVEQWHRPLVISTVRAVGAPAVTSTADQRWLIGLAGDSVQVFTVDSVHSTHDEALAVARLAQRQGWQSVALVTSRHRTST